MAFSLFRRKSGPPPATPGPPAPGKGDGGPPRHEEPEFGSTAGAEIEVSTASTSLPPVVEEAAVLFATGRVEGAIEALRREVAEPSAPPDAWAMLFDLYRLLGKRQDFEDMAVEFSVRFERSPPTWPETSCQAANNRPPPATSVTLSGALSDAKPRQLADVQAAARREGPLTLKCERLQDVEESGASALLDLLRRAREGGRRVTVSGAGVLERLLRERLAHGGRDYWLLLLELYHALGRRDDFESLCVDYAVGFEVSPPSWEEPPTSPPVARQELPPYAADDEEEAYPLRGDISWASVPQLDELASFASGRARVVVDMSGVTRIDFASSGMLLNTLSGLRGAGKEIVIIGANALVAALLCVVGVDRLATLVRGKQY